MNSSLGLISLEFSVSFPNSLHEKPKPAGPLVIPALQNRDWRELARKRKTANLYVPPSGAATTGADGSVGGLGTRDTINSGPQLSGLQVGSNKRMKTEDVDMEEEATPPPPSTVQAKTEETEDQKALRLLLAGDDPSEGQIIDIIPPPSEDEAYRQDVVELPDSATLDDYDRVPVSQFGAALLRGMGWKEGEAATRRVGKNGEKKGMVEPWLPTSRPALLGIGAKEKEALDDGSSLGKKGGVTKKRGKPDTKYMPLLKVEKRGGDDRDSRERESRSGSSSRRRSPEPEERKCSRRSSPDPDRRRDRDRDYDRDKDRRGEDRYRERDRDRDREDKYRERDRDDRDKDRKRERERDYESSSRRDRDRDDHRRRDRDRERSPDRSRR